MRSKLNKIKHDGEGPCVAGQPGGGGTHKVSARWEQKAGGLEDRDHHTTCD